MVVKEKIKKKKRAYPHTHTRLIKNLWSKKGRKITKKPLNKTRRDSLLLSTGFRELKT